MRISAVSSVCACIWPALAVAQILGPIERVNQVLANGVGYSETAIAVSAINPSELVALAIESPGGGGVEFTSGSHQTAGLHSRGAASSGIHRSVRHSRRVFWELRRATRWPLHPQLRA